MLPTTTRYTNFFTALSNLKGKLLEILQVKKTLFNGEFEIFPDQCSIHIFLVNLDYSLNSANSSF